MIESLKDLEKLLRLCRKQGVQEIKLGSVELKLGDLPDHETRGSQVQDLIPSDNPYANFPDGELTPEQLMFYSSGGKPEDDPYLKEQ
jgi:hypothetical protein